MPLVLKVVLAAPQQVVGWLDIHSFIDAKYRQALVAIHKEDYSGAYNQIQKLIQICLNRGLEIYTVALKLCEAEIHVLASSYVTALPHVLAYITQSKKYHLMTVGASAKILLADIQLSMDKNARSVIQLVESTMPMVLQHCSLEIVSNAYLVLSKCYMSLGEMDHCLRHLHLAEEVADLLDFKKKRADLYLLKAKVFHSLGDECRRDEAATLFLNVQQELNQSIHTHNDKLYFLTMLGL
eukprot:TRINITY_DN8396_c0_g1_i3.p1 TRINITY_DN8396_c0_g1~~TRINITY_DN8396_c0_g1_i3.p1  ORF type:complete len:239 (-),score=49.97 TRINITY_DN8396_c0_g1_i3:300-1016(-)